MCIVEVCEIIYLMLDRFAVYVLNKPFVSRMGGDMVVCIIIR